MKACRPLLGTYVEIDVDARDEALEARALDAGFAAIARVQQLMSAFEPTSDVGRINACGGRDPVVVDDWTADLLALARVLFDVSGGLFDCAVVPAGAASEAPAGTIAELRIRHRTVTASSPLRLDLGGIAKGYAVDRAADAIRAAGATGAVINAGGDLRVLGSRETPIYLRDPAAPQTLRFAGMLADGACATSAGYFSAREQGGATVCALVDPRTGAALPARHSFTVLAPSCALADGLTKVVAVSQNPDHPCLAQFGATALVLTEPPAADPLADVLA